MEIVPGSSSEGVILDPSRKQISPAIRWTFTLNNYNLEEEGDIRSIVPRVCRYAIIGQEVGESNTPHLQGYVEFKNKLRPMSVFHNKRFHWEKAKGNKKQNIDYCSKEKVWLIHPEPVQVITKDQLYDWQKQVIEEIKEDADDRKIIWICSELGGVGKTTFQKYLVVKEDFIILGGKSADIKHAISEYHKINGKTPERICINIPRCHDSHNYDGFEQIKDMLFYSGKYEGGMVCGKSPHLYIFANAEPEIYKMSEDRWIIRRI